ncbi:lipocalin-like domain-containing protein [Serratia fonticola]|uniref:lipocalin-like domain-containing protein n=1 Tax=Serratia fonticola TaxID=47917 RepID=UPI00192ADF21|nr:lipocalin-like domain-containing protein [Serratia fonticola]MBL5862180.1 lipocalin-like domain-containing protein [Serratia fonticola]
MMRELVGCWRLESVEYRVNGKRVYPFGECPSGRLVYSENGYMSVILMTSGRKRIGFLSDLFYTREVSVFAKFRGLLRYMRASIQGMSYSGRYTREGDQVTHYIDVASYPDLEGEKRVRWIEFDGNHLVLKAQDAAVSHGRLVWRRETPVEQRSGVVADCTGREMNVGG